MISGIKAFFTTTITRSRYNAIFIVISIVVAVFSLYVAYNTMFTENYAWWGVEGKKLGTFLIAFWVLGPPVFFWLDWVWYCAKLTTEEKEQAKHTHDLSRNIWLALVAILAVALGISI